RRRHTRCLSDWSSDVCSSDLVHHDLLGWLGLSAEARSRRSLHSDSVIAIGTSRNWEFRAGLSISFGGGHQDAIATTATGVIMPRSEERRVGKECRDGGWRAER